MTNHNRLSYSVRRYYVDTFFFKSISGISEDGPILDLGGHKVQKRGCFDIDQYRSNVTYLNLTSHKQPDVQADAFHLPFQNNYYNAVICAELLEHILNPVDVLREAYRVLRQNRPILITVPFLFPIHGDPSDYGRYTDYYWRSVLDEIGFQKVSIEKQGLYLSVMINFIKLYANRSCHSPIRQVVRWPLALLQQWAFKQEQRQWVKTDPFLSSFTTGFGIVAFK